MFFLFLIGVIIIIFIIIFTSEIGLEINNLKVNTENQEILNKDYIVEISVIILHKIKIIKRNIKNINSKNIRVGNRTISTKAFKKKDINIDYKLLIKNISVKKVKLNIEIGTENAALTAIIVGFISAIIGIIIKMPKYKIIPIYNGKNLLKIDLDCIIRIYLIHYIYEQILNKISKRKKVKNNERTSNRKPYDNCYE